MALDVNALIDKLPPLRIPGLHSRESIGIDIGSTAVKIVQIKEIAKKLQVVRWSAIPITTIAEGDKSEPSPEEKKANITSNLRTYRGSGKKIPKNAVTSISGTPVIVRYVKFPKIEPKELAKNIKTEAEPYIPFNIEEVYIAYYPLREITEDGKQKTETVLVAAKKDFINQRIEIFEQAGFKPAVIDVDAFTLETVYELIQEKKPPEETVLIANIGYSKTNFSVIEKGLSVVVKDSPIAGNNINKSISKLTGVDARAAEKLKNSYGILLTEEEKSASVQDGNKEALSISEAMLAAFKDWVNETKKIIQFYLTQGKDKKIDRLLVTGGSSNIKNLLPYLSNEFKLPVDKLNPFDKISGAEGIPEEARSMLTIAAGLALRKIEG